MHVIPKDQMSTFPSYWPSSMAKMTSGAILRKQAHPIRIRKWAVHHLIVYVTHQYGVPTKEFAGQAMDADPKSASFTCPGSVSKMFPALISLSKMRKKNLISMEHKQASGAQVPSDLKHSPVNHVVGVQVSQPLKSAMSNCSDFDFLQRFFVNWRVKTFDSGRVN